jgi:serine/threonine-protein kinase
VLYEMLTGRTPFHGERREAIEYAALHQSVAPPSASRAGVSPELDGIVVRLLAREPAERYASAEAVTTRWPRWSRHPVRSRHPPHPVMARRSRRIRPPTTRAGSAVRPTSSSRRSRRSSIPPSASCALGWPVTSRMRSPRRWRRSARCA